MRITYDQNVGASALAQKFGRNRSLVEADIRHLAGIEILDAVKRLGDPSAFKRVTLEDVAIAH
jgi:hypothetical protein